MPELKLEAPDASAVVSGDDLARAERYRGVLRWLWVANRPRPACDAGAAGEPGGAALAALGA